MKMLTIIAVMVTLAAGSSAQTNAFASLYLHFGVETANSAKRLLSTQVHLGEVIFVGGDDYWKLTGHIERRGTNFVADLVGETGSQSQFYRGAMPLEEPFYAQGGAASGGVTPMWFVLSTNADSKPIVERVKEMTKHRLEQIR